VGSDLRAQTPRPPGGGIERQIVQLGATMALCFVLMALGVGYWSVLRAPNLVARSDNPRLIEAERRVRRGNILDRQGRPLVVSEPGPNGTWQRVYLVPEAAPVVGYNSIDHGTSGIEAAYDAQIRGTRAQDPLEALTTSLLHEHPAGVSVTLTIDLDAQQAANRALGIRSGAIVVLDVQSGDVLAMISKPTFDPNTLEADWPHLQYSPDKPMLNRALQGLYPPGLVFETITLAAALGEGLAEPTTVYTDELGVVLSVDPPISCPTEPPQTRFTLTEAYAWPCSVLFARLGLELGGDQLADYATQLGVGRPLPLPIDAATGQLLERGRWSDVIAARTGMGQGEVLVTPMEMALVVATLANEGTRPVPELVRAVGSERSTPAGIPRQVLSPEVARQVQEILTQAFEAGRRAASLSPVDMAGRAGSAESGKVGAPPHAWFIGFAPAQEPRYAIAVIVEYGDDGWSVAAPIAAQALAPLIERR
jgi:peptidoglycan glycosyltransferase